MYDIELQSPETLSGTRVKISAHPLGLLKYSPCADSENSLSHTGQCKHTGGCYNELVVAFFSTSGGVKGKKFYTC